MLLLYPVVLTRHADHVVVSAIPANDEIPQSVDRDQLLPTTTGGETACNNQLQFKAAVGDGGGTAAEAARRQR